MADAMARSWYTEEMNEQIKNMKEFGVINTKDISDGYHTFEELYHHRTVLFATICNMYYQYYGHSAWKSKLHEDGTMYENMFIAGFETFKGTFTYHCEMEYWDMFEIEELDKAPKWDGHTSEDVTRMLSIDI